MILGPKNPPFQSISTYHDIWGLPSMGIPQNGWFTIENPTKMGWWLGYPYFRKSPFLIQLSSSWCCASRPLQIIQIIQIIHRPLPTLTMLPTCNGLRPWMTVAFPSGGRKSCHSYGALVIGISEYPINLHKKWIEMDVPNYQMDVTYTILYFHLS